MKADLKYKGEIFRILNRIESFTGVHSKNAVLHGQN